MGEEYSALIKIETWSLVDITPVPNGFLTAIKARKDILSVRTPAPLQKDAASNTV